MPESNPKAVQQSNGSSENRIEAIVDATGSASRRGPDIVIFPLKLIAIEVPIIGLTPLITNPYSTKVLKQWEEERASDETIEGKPAGKKGSKKPRSPRDYEQEYQNSQYKLEGREGFGMPAIAFKRAIVEACTQLSVLDFKSANLIITV
jgi:hypothetical protein